MSLITYAIRSVRCAYYCAALRQLTQRDPLHPDVPALVVHVRLLLGD